MNRFYKLFVVVLIVRVILISYFEFYPRSEENAKKMREKYFILEIQTLIFAHKSCVVGTKNTERKLGNRTHQVLLTLIIKAATPKK